MAASDPLNLWVTEHHRDIVGLTFKVEKTLFSGRSPYQQVDVIQTAGHGRMLLNDGIVMISERDEFIYHEMIAHVPLFVHPDPKSVLIIGGGDGGTAREVLKHRGVERAVMVEIDELVVQACRKYMPSVCCAFDDPRLDLKIADGVSFVAETNEQFDVILVDSTDPIGPAQALFNRDFYRRVAEILSPDGILITQAESPFYDTDVQSAMLGNQREFFERLHLYLFNTLIYPGGLWCFGFASKGLCPVRNFDPKRVDAAGVPHRYYHAGVHTAAFQLPACIRSNFSGLLDSIPPEAQPSG